MSDQSSKEQGESSIVPTEEAPRMELPSWGQGRSKRKANQNLGQPDGALDRGVRAVGTATFNRVYLVVGGIILVAGLIAGGEAWMHSRDSRVAASTRTLDKGAAALARGEVVPEGQELPKASENPVARSDEELLAAAKESLRAAQASGDDGVELAALLGEGGIAMRKGEPDIAAQHYKKFLDDAAADHPLRPIADESYALALEDAKKLDEALAALSKIPGHESSSRLSWHRGRILVALERRDEAREVLNSVVTRGDGSFEANLAKAMLARLDVAKGAAAPAVPKDDAAVPKVEPTQENAATGSAGEP